MKERLQKVLSAQNILSRRDAEKAIKNGQIKVNGKVAIVGQKVDPAVDKIEIDPVLKQRRYTTIAFNKPRGIVTNCPQNDEKSIQDLLPKHLKGLSSIGRLDKDSEGLILLTDDGVVAKSYLGTDTPHTRTYEVWIDVPLTDDQRSKLESGIPLFGRTTKPLKINRKSPTHLIWRMQEGKNRQIRRMLQKMGRKVLRLKRIQFGEVALGGLRSGKFRIVDKPMSDV